MELFYPTCKSNSKSTLTVDKKTWFSLSISKGMRLISLFCRLSIGAYNISSSLLVIPSHLKILHWAESWCWKRVFSPGNFWTYRKCLWNIGNNERKKCFLIIYVCVLCNRNTWLNGKILLFCHRIVLKPECCFIPRNSMVRSKSRKEQSMCSEGWGTSSVKPGWELWLFMLKKRIFWEEFRAPSST